MNDSNVNNAALMQISFTGNSGRYECEPAKSENLYTAVKITCFIRRAVEPMNGSPILGSSDGEAALNKQTSGASSEAPVSDCNNIKKRRCEELKLEPLTCDLATDSSLIAFHVAEHIAGSINPDYSCRQTLYNGVDRNGIAKDVKRALRLYVDNIQSKTNSILMIAGRTGAAEFVGLNSAVSK